jgi:hypothetical protein
LEALCSEAEHAVAVTRTEQLHRLRSKQPAGYR